jgi:hypothetical protein
MLVARLNLKSVLTSSCSRKSHKYNSPRESVQVEDYTSRQGKEREEEGVPCKVGLSTLKWLLLSHLTSTMQTPNDLPADSASVPPSPLADSHRNLRPQLTPLGGCMEPPGPTQRHSCRPRESQIVLRVSPGTWTSSSESARAPVVFFRTADMPDIRHMTWTKLQAYYSFTHPAHPASGAFDRSSGLGPVHGRPP